VSITQRERRIAVIGLGYVGLSLAVEIAKAYPGGTIGFDAKANRIDELKTFNDRNDDVETAVLAKSGIDFTSDASVLQTANVFIVCVPTPVHDGTNKPDFGFLISASETIGRMMPKGSLIIFESTVSPGTTEGICAAALRAASGMARTEFRLGYSPERVSPGDTAFKLRTTSKIVSGQDEETTQEVFEIYKSVLDNEPCRAASIKVAEASKLLENMKRDVNIALLNEFALVCRAIGIDMADVLAMANTKKGFKDAEFAPGLVGGHCIGVDPYYFVDLAEDLGRTAHLTIAARQVNQSMALEIVERVKSMLGTKGVKPEDACIGILGVTFKEDVRDTRNSRVTDIVKLLVDAGIECLVHDPVVLPEHVDIKIEPDTSRFGRCDVVILAVQHKDFLKPPMAWLGDLKDGAIVFDVKSALKREAFPARLRYEPL
jgi:UDP-N-acetyl-D-galactosamine dehydrogenase